MKFLQRPYPALSSLRKRLILCISFSFFVFAFLLVFQPFGIGLTGNLLLLSSGYGLSCFVTMFVLNIIVVSLVPAFFKEERWTTARELLWSLVNVALIGLANAVYTSIVFNSGFTFYSFFIFEFYTLAVSILPVSISILAKRHNLENRYEKESQTLNEKIQSGRSSDFINEGLILIRSENEKENLQLNVKDLLFVRSADNYAEVHFRFQEQLKKSLLRTTLKKISEDHQDESRLFRCHKSYLVNLEKVDHVSGNAQGLKLHLDGIDEIIPVSRNLNETIKKKLTVQP